MAAPQLERLAITSDYVGNKVSLGPRLKAIQRHGYSDVMHCHGWKMDEQYTNMEIAQLAILYRDLSLGVVDIHGSQGTRRQLWSPNHDEQNQGIALVENRLHLANSLRTDVVVLHIPAENDPLVQPTGFWNILDRAMTALRPTMERYGVRIAFENYYDENGLPRNFSTLKKVFRILPSNLIGLCYDSGHGNVDGDGINRLEEVKDRLIAVHLHGNKGQSDEHDLPFAGTIDWNTLTKVLATSSYHKPLSLESSARDSLGFEEHEDDFLNNAMIQGQRLTIMVQAAKV